MLTLSTLRLQSAVPRCLLPNACTLALQYLACEVINHG